MKLEKIIARAIAKDRIKDNLVLCDNCDNPALKSAALKMSWVGCGPCYFGESDALDLNDIIVVARNKQ